MTEIHSMRSDFLTTLFALGNYVTHPFFYTLIIAFGYWIKPRNKNYKFLGALIPLTYIISIIANNIVMYPRPPFDLRLIPIGNDVYSLPNTGMTVAIVFWCMMVLNSGGAIHHVIVYMLFCFYIGLYEWYYGLSNGFANILSAAFGILLFFLWNLQATKKGVNNWYSGKTSNYWLLVTCLVVGYFVFRKHSAFIPHIAYSIGMLIGYGMSLGNMTKWTKVYGAHEVPHFFTCLIFFAVLIFLMFAISRPIPAMQQYPFTKLLSETAKYAALGYYIFFIVPKLIEKFLYKEELNDKFENIDTNN